MRFSFLLTASAESAGGDPEDPEEDEGEEKGKERGRSWLGEVEKTAELARRADPMELGQGVERLLEVMMWLSLINGMSDARLPKNEPEGLLFSISLSYHTIKERSFVSNAPVEMEIRIFLSIGNKRFDKSNPAFEKSHNRKRKLAGGDQFDEKLAG